VHRRSGVDTFVLSVLFAKRTPQLRQSIRAIHARSVVQIRAYDGLIWTCNCVAFHRLQSDFESKASGDLGLPD